MKRFSKKAVAVGLAVGLSLGLAGTALAFWTTGGTGTGTATAGVPNSNLTITAAPTSGLLYPDGATAVPLTLSVVNPNAYSVDLYGDTATINSGSIKCGSTTVPDAWFTLSSGPITNTSVTPANQAIALAQTGTSGLTLTMNDDPANSQDVCQGATVTFALTVSSATGH